MGNSKVTGEQLKDLHPVGNFIADKIAIPIALAGLFVMLIFFVVLYSLGKIART